MDRFNKTIQVRPRQDYHREQYDIYARPVAGVEIKVASTTVDFDPGTYSGARRPGSNEARFDRSERPDRGAPERSGGGPAAGGGGGGGRDRGRDRDRGRGRDRGNRGPAPAGSEEGRGGAPAPSPSAPSAPPGGQEPA
jgi:hypothetical protein